MIQQTISKFSILILISWSVKLLLIPGYYSTDFNVHQNWLRITSNLPISQWYYNDDSKWTLDYPPFFAYFQFILAKVGTYINPKITSNINEEIITIYYQRITVIITDLLYLLVLGKFYQWHINFKLVILYYFIPFIILDSNNIILYYIDIHFQYNLMLQALFVYSVYLMNQKRYLVSAFVYSTLLNFKHIYLYCAPAYFIYLLLEYVIKDEQGESIAVIMSDKIKQEQEANNLRKNSSQNLIKNKIIRLGKLGFITVVPFLISFAPFLYQTGVAGIGQIFTKLFPFQRGLIHQLWAPNIWALYYLMDKVLYFISKKLIPFLHLGSFIHLESNSTSVNDLKFLPQISPRVTIAIILLLLLPLIYKCYKSYTTNTKQQSQSNKISFVSLLCMSGLIFFMFGYHVHEKAITPYISIMFMFLNNVQFMYLAIFVNIVNFVTLLINPGEQLLVIIFCMIWKIIWDIYYPVQVNEDNEEIKIFPKISFNNLIVQIYPKIGWILILYYCIGSSFIKSKSLQFLPIMLNSVWAAIFNCIWVILLYIRFMRNGTIAETH